MSNSYVLKDTFRSLRHPNYRLFFGGQSISLIGTWIQRIALPWLVYDVTKSVLLLGVVGFVGQIPTFLLSPYAGVLADRWNKYHIMIITQVLSMIQACILAVLVLTGSIEIWSILLLSGFLGCINAFDTPARQSFIIEMIENKEDLSNAIALNSSMFNVARLIGPSIAGILISVTGEGVCFLINAISYFFVVGSLLLMKVKPKENKQEKKPVLRELKEGFSYTFGILPIKYIIMLLTLVAFMGMPYTVLMPVFAKEILHGGPHTFGFLMGAGGLGALISALFLASKKDTSGLEKIIPIAAGIFGTALLLFSFSRLFIPSLILMTIIGFSMVMQTASSNTLLQTVVDDNKRGRVMSFYTMAFMGTAPFGSLLAGGLAKAIGAPDTIMFGGVTCIIGALVFAHKLPEISKAIRGEKTE
jgi:MFS family permease